VRFRFVVGWGILYGRSSVDPLALKRNVKCYVTLTNASVQLVCYHSYKHSDEMPRECHANVMLCSLEIKQLPYIYCIA
jgi:hypothetical protein